MFKLVTIEDTVRIPPNLLGMKLADAALSILRERYERTIDKNLGIVLAIFDAKIKGNGRIIPGDAGAYFQVQFNTLVFTLKVNEIVDGEIFEIVDFGAFVRLGPIDGLIHVSQMANEFMSYDKKQQILIAKQSKKSFRKGDLVRAKVATVSFKESIPNSKIALTMRPIGLGKIGKK